VFADFDLPEECKAQLIKTTKHRLGLHAVKVQANVQVTCFTYHGINGIIPALRAGQNVGTKDMPIDIQLICSPHYTLATTSCDSDAAAKILEDAIRAIQDEIIKYGGECVVKSPPREEESMK